VLVGADRQHRSSRGIDVHVLVADIDGEDERASEDLQVDLADGPRGRA